MRKRFEDSDSMKDLKATVAWTVELVAAQHQFESHGFEILQSTIPSSQSVYEADGRSDHDG